MNKKLINYWKRAHNAHVLALEKEKKDRAAQEAAEKVKVNQRVTEELKRKCDDELQSLQHKINQVVDLIKEGESTYELGKSRLQEAMKDMAKPKLIAAEKVMKGATDDIKKHRKKRMC